MTIRSRRLAAFSTAIAIAALAASALGVSAQGASPAMSPAASMAPMGATAKVRVLHASPDAPAVDVYADGSAVLKGVAFGTISDYLEVPAGDHRIQVFAADADPATAKAVIDATVPFAAGTMTTVAATNVLAKIEAQVISDAPAPVADKAQIRVVHLSADAPAVDVAPDGAAPIVKNLSYPNATDYLTVPAAAYDLEIRPAGTMDVALQLDPITLDAGNSYSAFAIGSLAGGTLKVLPALDASVAAPVAGTAKVRVLHASPDAPAVDVYLDDTAVEALTNVTFGTISGYLDIPAGMHNVKVFATGSDPATATPVIAADLDFAAGTMTTVAATNKLAKIEAQVIADAPKPVADQAQIRFIHFSADAPAVAIASDGKRKAIVKKLAYPKATKYLTVPAGTYNLEIRVAGKPKKVVLQLDPITLEAGTSVSAFAIGSAADGTLKVVIAPDATVAP